MDITYNSLFFDVHELTKKDRYGNDITEEMLHVLCMQEYGDDCHAPRGYLVLVKLFKPNNKDIRTGMYRADREIEDELRVTMCGKVLRIGVDCFTDKYKFPSGAFVYPGEWALFRGDARNRIRDFSLDGGTDLAFVNDDCFIGSTLRPQGVKTAFDMVSEYQEK